MFLDSGRKPQREPIHMQGEHTIIIIVIIIIIQLNNLGGI